MRRKLDAWLLAISLTMTAASAAQAPAEDQLARFMEKVRQDITGLRDCTCLETMERSRRRPPHSDFAPIDTVRLEVSTIAGKELFAGPGHRFEDRDAQSLIRSGTIGSGMFSTFVQNLFVKRKGTLRYVRQENVDGRRLVRYDFRATRQESGFKLQVANISEMVAAKGSFWFDAASLDLVRLEIHAVDLPFDLHLDDAVVRVEYARTHIGDSEALLPKRSEMTLTYISSDADRNVISFSQCREYRSDSAIDFGKGSNAPAQGAGQARQTRANPEPVPAETPVPTPIQASPESGAPPASAPPVPSQIPMATAATGVRQADTTVVQAPPPSPPAPANPPPPAPRAPITEITWPDAPVSFKSEVNLVMVPVVVRDRKGNSIGGLRKEDFRLFDGGRKQEITHFSVHRSASTVTQSPDRYIGPTAEKQPPTAHEVVPAERLVAYVFDDVDIKFEDLVYVRDAAWRNISESLQPADRVAVVATSGRTLLDFTDDRAKIHDTLFQLRPNSIYRPAGRDCPDLNLYQAYAIASGMAGGVNAGPNSKGSATSLPISPLLKVAIEDLENCNPMFDPRAGKPDPVRENMEVEAAAARVVSWREREIDVVFNTLKRLSHRMASMSGQRSIILASPGFLVTEALRPLEMELIDEAIRAGVVISALDALGLGVLNPAGEIDEFGSPGAPHPHVIEEKVPFRKAEIEGGAQALGVLAEGTGGKFIENSNDLIGAYRQLANAPEFIYVLGFTLKDVKPNGSFHPLVVRLATGAKYDLQARSGYYAPQAGDEKVAQGRPEIKDAVFSQLEIRTLSAELRTEVDSSDPANVKLTVTVGVDTKKLRIGNDLLTAVVALFDNNGSFIAGNQGSLDLRPRAETSNLNDQPPLQLKAAFNVKPGDYRVRLVMHDEQAQIIETQNQAVTVR
ncbi:MAG: VWA domain-containing protein [Bryobacteraceae bacterium]|jgi:VWFA-related protein